jgi:hypothetical protein
MKVTATSGDPAIDYLRMVNEVMGKGKQINFAGFLLEHGRSWKNSPLPKDIKPMTMKLCFCNAAKLAMRRKDLTYVEGFASLIIPTQHAWCVDAKGNVIDPTWRDAESATYFGIPFKTEFLTKFLRNSKIYGVLDRWDIGFPLQTGKYPKEDWLKQMPTVPLEIS